MHLLYSALHIFHNAEEWSFDHVQKKHRAVERLSDAAGLAALQHRAHHPGESVHLSPTAVHHAHQHQHQQSLFVDSGAPQSVHRRLHVRNGLSGHPLRNLRRTGRLSQMRRADVHRRRFCRNLMGHKRAVQRAKSPAPFLAAHPRFHAAAVLGRAAGADASMVCGSGIAEAPAHAGLSGCGFVECDCDMAASAGSRRHGHSPLRRPSCAADADAFCASGQKQLLSARLSEDFSAPAALRPHGASHVFSCFKSPRRTGISTFTTRRF